MCKRECANGSEPELVLWLRFIPWHSDNESLFGPQIKAKLIVSTSLGNSVEFEVRRVSGDVPSLITLDHGDLLVMDGPAQLEYAPGLQGPRVDLTYGWVTGHCVLSTCRRGGLCSPLVCARFSRAGFPRVGSWENKWISFLGRLVLLLSILVFCLLVSTWINIRRRALSQLSTSILPDGAPPSQRLARWVGGGRWRLSRRCHSSKRRSFYFSFNLFKGRKLCSFFKCTFFLCVFCWFASN